MASSSLTSNSLFIELLRKELAANSSNYFTDNYDFYTFSKKKPIKKRFINLLKRFFFSGFILNIILGNDFLYRKVFLGYLFHYGKYLQPLEFFYNNLASVESKKLLLRLVSFRLLGYLKVKLPLSTPEYWSGIKEFEKNATTNDFLQTDCFPWKLDLLDLSFKGYPLKVYLNSKAAYTTFGALQYIKVDNDKNLGPKAGDIILDMGGCYGDTALFFSNLAGQSGKVYSFEFIPGNIKVFRKNMALNPEYKNRIEIVENPLWNKSKMKMYYKDAGAASTIRFEKFEAMSGETETLSVDDFVESRNLAKVDFIKSDIEGAEPFMLQGAINTLRKFKPTLAIAIYHNMNDFTGIIKQIADLGIGYKFYLGHYTIYASETILYAVPAK